MIVRFVWMQTAGPRGRDLGEMFGPPALPALLPTSFEGQEREVFFLNTVILLITVFQTFSLSNGLRLYLIATWPSDLCCADKTYCCISQMY